MKFKSMRAALLPIVFAVVSNQGRAQNRPTIYDEPLSERLVTYDIVADLDVETRAISGIERITWRNTDRVPVGELQFHLYLNAFAGPKSTFVRESGGVHRDYHAQEEDPWGGIEVTSLRVVDDGMPPHTDFTSLPVPSVSTRGTDLTSAMEFIRPDDGNEDDFTVMRVMLPEPVEPGETITLNVEFVSRLPEIVARTGWKRKTDGSMFFMVGQWFPKLGVYEVPGQRYVPADAGHGVWNTHQFHANSEFYSNFGSYRVSMTVPESYKVGASGIRLSEEVSDGRKTIVHWAEDVHDFAWTASPEYLEFTDSWKHVTIHLAIQPEHKGQVQRHFDAAKVALEYFDEWYGEYPYTTLTLVDGIGGSNGMEYPTLITCGTTYAAPEWFRLLEIIIIHEFGHQYWYGLLASNEFEEAWLDEGINSYTELAIMDAEYGPGSVIDIPGWQVNNATMQRVLYTHNGPTRDRMYMNSWEYMTNSSYGVNSYWKPATVLHTLENYVGVETMRAILRTYYDRWRFRHPTTRDFVDVANEVAGEDLSWYFDQFIYGSVAIDYRVVGIANRKITPDSVKVPEYRTRVVLQNKEEGVFPVDVVVTFEDGTKKRLAWDGREKWKTFTFYGPHKGVEAVIDPDDKLTLDLDRTNNRETNEPDSRVGVKYGLKSLVWLQQLLQFFGALM